MSPDLVCGRPPPVLENNKSDGWNKPTPEPHGVLSSVTLKDNCLRDNPQDGLNEKFVLLSTFGWKDVRSVRLLPFTSDPKIVEGLFGRKPFLNRWTCLGFCHLMMKSKPPPQACLWARNTWWISPYDEWERYHGKFLSHSDDFPTVTYGPWLLAWVSYRSSSFGSIPGLIDDHFSSEQPVRLCVFSARKWTKWRFVIYQQIKTVNYALKVEISTTLFWGSIGFWSQMCADLIKWPSVTRSHMCSENSSPDPNKSCSKVHDSCERT